MTRPPLRTGTWRQGLITLSGILPISLALNTLVGPRLSHVVPPPLVVVINAIVLVAVLNWAFLPLAQWATRGWASRDRRAGG